MKGTILLVHDDYLVRFGLTKRLERQDYVVLPYEDGREVIDNIEEGLKFDVAVLDLSLPHVDGEELTRYIKSKNNSTPVIIISEYPRKPSLADRLVPSTALLESGNFLERTIEELTSKKD